jgi:hypothetical protein
LEATKTELELSWEMVLAADNPSSPEALTILAGLPEEIHVFVQVPTLDRGRLEEPQVYWSTDANITETGLIPAGAFEIRMNWDIEISTMRWESHHYEVAKRAQEEHGFDPTTTAASESLDLPLLAVVDSVDPAEVGTCSPPCKEILH